MPRGCVGRPQCLEAGIDGAGFQKLGAHNWLFTEKRPANPSRLLVVPECQWGWKSAPGQHDQPGQTLSPRTLLEGSQGFKYLHKCWQLPTEEEETRPLCVM